MNLHIIYTKKKCGKFNIDDIIDYFRNQISLEEISVKNTDIISFKYNATTNINIHHFEEFEISSEDSFTDKDIKSILDEKREIINENRANTLPMHDLLLCLTDQKHVTNRFADFIEGDINNGYVNVNDWNGLELSQIGEYEVRYPIIYLIMLYTYYHNSYNNYNQYVENLITDDSESDDINYFCFEKKKIIKKILTADIRSKKTKDFIFDRKGNEKNKSIAAIVSFSKIASDLRERMRYVYYLFKNIPLTIQIDEEDNINIPELTVNKDYKNQLNKVIQDASLPFLYYYIVIAYLTKRNVLQEDNYLTFLESQVWVSNNEAQDLIISLFLLNNPDEFQEIVIQEIEDIKEDIYGYRDLNALIIKIILFFQSIDSTKMTLKEIEGIENAIRKKKVKNKISLENLKLEYLSIFKDSNNLKNDKLKSLFEKLSTEIDDISFSDTKSEVNFNKVTEDLFQLLKVIKKTEDFKDKITNISTGNIRKTISTINNYLKSISLPIAILDRVKIDSTSNNKYRMGNFTNDNNTNIEIDKDSNTYHVLKNHFPEL